MSVNQRRTLEREVEQLLWRGKQKGAIKLIQQWRFESEPLEEQPVDYDAVGYEAGHIVYVESLRKEEPCDNHDQ